MTTAEVYLLVDQRIVDMERRVVNKDTVILESID